MLWEPACKRKILSTLERRFRPVSVGKKTIRGIVFRLKRADIYGRPESKRPLSGLCRTCSAPPQRTMGRVGSRRDPNAKAHALHGLLHLAYGQHPALPELTAKQRVPLLECVGEECRCQWQMQAGGSPMSKGAEGVGFSSDAPRLLRIADRESR